jgi:hypothetical protein
VDIRKVKGGRGGGSDGLSADEWSKSSAGQKRKGCGAHRQTGQELPRAALRGIVPTSVSACG